MSLSTYRMISGKIVVFCIIISLYEYSIKIYSFLVFALLKRIRLSDFVFSRANWFKAHLLIIRICVPFFQPLYTSRHRSGKESFFLDSQTILQHTGCGEGVLRWAKMVYDAVARYHGYGQLGKKLMENVHKSANRGF